MSTSSTNKRSAEESIQSAPKRRKPIPRVKKPLVKWKTKSNDIERIGDTTFTSINCLQADDKKVVFADENCVRVLQLNTLKLDNRTQNVQHKAAIRCLQYDNEKIITGGEDGKFRVWNALKQFKCDADEDVAKGEGVEEINTLQFNKQLLYLGTTKNIRVYDLESK
jgi:WD40 repeat protein